MLLAIEQTLNGLQLGVTLFLMTAGLTLTFGVMGIINLAHGSLYMAGAYAAALVGIATGSFVAGILAAIVVAGAFGLILETAIFRGLYHRNHLDQVLATFALILVFNGTAGMIFGRTPYQIDVPAFLSGPLHITEDFSYPLYRLVIIGVGIVVGVMLYLLISRTRAGMLVRAGSTHRDMVRALGVDLPGLFTLVFAFGAALAGIAGAIIGPVHVVEVGMGDPMVILGLVVIVIGGVGSVRGAAVASVIVGLVDTMGRSYVPQLLKSLTNPEVAASISGAISATSVYVLMAIILLIKPSGLFGGKV